MRDRLFSYSGLCGIGIYWNNWITQKIYESHWLQVHLPSYSDLYETYWNNNVIFIVSLVLQCQ